MEAKVASKTRSETKIASDLIYEALQLFSKDLVHVVVSYLFCGPVTNCKPNLLCKVGSFGEGDGQFKSACVGVAVSPTGAIWVTSSNTIQIFDENFAFVARSDIAYFQLVRGIAIADNGTAYIAGGGYRRITVCDSEGRVKEHICNGSSLARDPHFQAPRCLAIDNEQGLLFVTDSSSPVQALTLEGKLVRRWGRFVRPPADMIVESAYGIAVNTAAREIAVVDQDKRCVLVCFACAQTLANSLLCACR